MIRCRYLLSFLYHLLQLFSNNTLWPVLTPKGHSGLLPGLQGCFEAWVVQIPDQNINRNEDKGDQRPRKATSILLKLKPLFHC